jgi:hypothetical protein
MMPQRTYERDKNEHDLVKMMMQRKELPRWDWCRKLGRKEGSKLIYTRAKPLRLTDEEATTLTHTLTARNAKAKIFLFLS